MPNGSPYQHTAALIKMEERNTHNASKLRRLMKLLLCLQLVAAKSIIGKVALRLTRSPFSSIRMSSNVESDRNIHFSNPRWEALWNSGVERGQFFDTGRSSPALLKLISENKIPEGRALVPGCGRGYDVITLASHSRKVLGLEIAPGAIDAAQDMLNSLPLSERPPVGSAEFHLTNFFDMPTDEKSVKFDFIYDYTFLCALDPSIRDLWASKMADLLNPGGVLLTLIYPISETKEDGPPFRVTLDIVKNLLVTAGFEQLQLEILPFELCHPGREVVTGSPKLLYEMAYEIALLCSLRGLQSPPPLTHTPAFYLQDVLIKALTVSERNMNAYRDIFLTNTRLTYSSHVPCNNKSSMPLVT